ncbi:MAG: hypothetical protein ABSF22_03820 [Bryobacteraceae bacterium]
MKALLMMLLPLAAQAQLAIYAVNGTTETSVGSTYQLGQVPILTTFNVQFQIYNTGSTAVSVDVATLAGDGFTFEYPPVVPWVIPPNSTAAMAENIWVSFTPTSAASFSANLQIGPLSVILFGSGVSAPTLTSVAGCSGTPFNWGSVPAGSAATCTFALQNPNPQAVAVPSIVVNGLGFSGPLGVTAPLTLQVGQSASFSVTFTPPQALVYSGTLTIGTQSYALSGTGQPALLPTPSLQFDAGPFASGQQRVLTMTIPGGSPVAATGYVNLTFTPSTAVVANDSTIVFVAGSVRTLPFSVSAGATTVLLNGQNSATFQTGTTEGTITFTVTTAAALTGDPTTTITIPGAPVILESATASLEVIGSLVLTITGADNTYSTSTMTFSFFDTSGKPIGGVVSANFASAFKSYYATVDAAGSTFVAQIIFPLTGSAASIGTVTVTMTNAAGVANTGSLTFQ